MPNSYSSQNICQKTADVNTAILFSSDTSDGPENVPSTDYLNCTLVVETFADADCTVPELLTEGAFQIRVKTIGSGAWRTLEELEGLDLPVGWCGGGAYGDNQDGNDLLFQPSFSGRATQIRITPIGVVGNFYKVVTAQDGM